MKYVSTRGGAPVTLDQALRQGIAADGGLYLPETLPDLALPKVSDGDDIKLTARAFLAPFFAGSDLEKHLDDIIAETFHFPIPVSALAVPAGHCDVLELYHGPTAAFKDVGAGFLAACLSRLEGDATQPMTILVATSGDTGGAVAAAFDGRPGMRVIVLFPDGMVSARQAHQLTCWGDNVLSLAVDGTFDDCQAIVKAAMADPRLNDQHRFSSANSINIGRLLPQAIYYAHASVLHKLRTGNQPGFIIPTGNLGNAFACYLARATGMPIGDIILATNANRLIGDYLDGAAWEPRASIQTLASAMDVGNPSNMERLRHVGGEAKDLVGNIRAHSVTDEQITQQIRRDFDELNRVSCPHTATATFVWQHLDEASRLTQDWIIVATAHAAKFEQIVEPIIGERVALPAVLADILEKPSDAVHIEASMMAFEAALEDRFG
ncbi:MAG: threonine synthase [Woeseiaceae bacterium]